MNILRYGIPNSFTAASLLLGIASIVTGMLGDLELAGWMIVWCGLLDVMDGLTARLLKATSSFGAEFDSMADLVAFGVAPGMLVLQAGLQFAEVDQGSHSFAVLVLAIGVYVLAGASRLARFNLSTSKPSSDWFVGVPITACGGGLISTAVILLTRYPEVAEGLQLKALLPIMLFVLALLMVSTIRFPKMRKRDNLAMNLFQGANFLLTYYCGITRSFPEYLFFMGLALLVGGIVAGRISRYSEAADSN